MVEIMAWVKKFFVNGLLLLFLGAVLVAYLLIVSDLPARIYTSAQREFLDYNYGRTVSQEAPVYNVLTPETSDVLAVLPVEESSVEAALIARFEEQEGVSVTVYDLTFDADYVLSYAGPTDTTVVELFFPFPTNLETLHQVRFLVDGEEPSDVQYSTSGISWQATLESGTEHLIEISYQADGAGSFTYGLQREQRSDVDVLVTVIGVVGSEIPQYSLPTTMVEPVEGGEVFGWQYDGLIANRDIRVDLPAQLSFAQRVSQLQEGFRTLAALAPVLIALYLGALAAMLYAIDVRLRTHSYLLIGCGLALFYPSLTFLSGLVPVALAAVLALVPVCALLLIYSSLAIGWRRAVWRVGVLLVIFVGFFSLGLLTPWRGLFLTGGGVLLVGVFMFIYAGRSLAPEPEPLPTPAPTPDVPQVPQAAPPPSEPEPEPATVERHCPHCGRALAKDFLYCPACSNDVRPFRSCARCGHEQFVPPDLQLAHCVRCGKALG